MRLLRRLFRRGPYVKTVSSSKTRDEVVITGIPPTREGSSTAVLLERKYWEQRPCKCGGAWARIGGGSAYPNAYSVCVCSQCGVQKRFEFHFV